MGSKADAIRFGFIRLDTVDNTFVVNFYVYSVN